MKVLLFIVLYVLPYYAVYKTLSVYIWATGVVHFFALIVTLLTLTIVKWPLVRVE